MSLGIFGALVLNKIAETRVVAVAHRALKRDRLLRHLQHSPDALDRKLNFFSHFFRRRFPPVFLNQLLLHPHQFVDRLDHVDRNADRARLIRNRAGNRLANPPSGVSRKFVPAPILKFLDRFHQAHVSFLDQVQKREAAIGVFLGDGNDQPKVGFDHLGFGFKRLTQPIFQRSIFLCIIGS